MYPEEGRYPGEGVDPGEQITGTRDEHYDLVSVLYHALHGAENCDLYALDAEATGRADLVDFFREAQLVQMGLAERGKELLGIGSAVPGASGDLTAGAGVPPELPLETDFTLDEPVPGDVPPRMEQPGAGTPPEVAVPDEDLEAMDAPIEPVLEEDPPGEERRPRP